MDSNPAHLASGTIDGRAATHGVRWRTVGQGKVANRHGAGGSRATLVPGWEKSDLLDRRLGSVVVPVAGAPAGPALLRDVPARRRWLRPAPRPYTRQAAHARGWGIQMAC